MKCEAVHNDVKRTQLKPGEIFRPSYALCSCHEVLQPVIKTLAAETYSLFHAVQQPKIFPSICLSTPHFLVWKPQPLLGNPGLHHDTKKNIRMPKIS